MSKNQGFYDFIAKVLIIGDSGVGKTCLLLRFCDNTFTTSHLATIGKVLHNVAYFVGIDFKIKHMDVDSKKIKMQIWDTAGQDRFRSITQTYYKGAMGIILTYSATDKESFQNISNWMKQISEQASKDVSVVIVGNKSDMPEKVVQPEEGKALADSYGLKFFETSAKDDMGVNDAFYTIAREIKEKIQAKEPTPETGGNRNINIGGNQNKDGGKTGNKEKCC